jgi:hypothetical protein
MVACFQVFAKLRHSCISCQHVPPHVYTCSRPRQSPLVWYMAWRCHLLAFDYSCTVWYWETLLRFRLEKFATWFANDGCASCAWDKCSLLFQLRGNDRLDDHTTAHTAGNHIAAASSLHHPHV